MRGTIDESEPLIPADTPLLLTTKSSLVPASSEAGDVSFEMQLNTSAYERYFDKPEVLKAYREQQVIQTPEFHLLPVHEAVGGRFRPRITEDVRILCSVHSFATLLLIGYAFTMA